MMSTIKATRAIPHSGNGSWLCSNFVGAKVGGAGDCVGLEIVGDLVGLDSVGDCVVVPVGYFDGTTEGNREGRGVGDAVG